MPLRLSSNAGEIESGRAPARHSAVAVVVIAVHSAFLWLFATHIGAPAILTVAHELQVSVVAPRAVEPRLPPPPGWPLAVPEAVVIPVPEIDIAPDAGEDIVANPHMQRRAPQIDPGHPNPLPDLPGASAGTASPISLALRLLVLPDGTVGDVRVARSSGELDIDRRAVQFVRTNWHYLPATVDGKPIAAWIATIVRFRG